MNCWCTGNGLTATNGATLRGSTTEFSLTTFIRRAGSFERAGPMSYLRGPLTRQQSVAEGSDQGAETGLGSPAGHRANRMGSIAIAHTPCTATLPPKRIVLNNSDMPAEVSQYFIPVGCRQDALRWLSPSATGRRAGVSRQKEWNTPAY